MSKTVFKPGNMLYPLPAVLVTSQDKEGNANIFTVAWAATVCTNPPMVSISVRPERYSYRLIRETGEFVINLTTEQLAYATDYCGVKSGRDVDKFAELGLTKLMSKEVSVPGIEEAPVNIECKVRKVEELGSHHMFIADVVSVTVDDAYMDDKNTFHLADANPLAYCHGGYYGLGQKHGTFGYSVKKSRAKSNKPEAKSEERARNVGKQISGKKQRRKKQVR